MIYCRIYCQWFNILSSSFLYFLRDKLNFNSLLIVCCSEHWFSVNVKEPVAHAIVEVVEASDMKPSDFNGKA